MGTRNVVLTDRHEELIDDFVNKGKYQNASEVLRDGLRLIENRELEEKARLTRATGTTGAVAVAHESVALPPRIVKACTYVSVSS